MMLVVRFASLYIAAFLIAFPVINSWARRRRSQLARAQSSTIAGGGPVLVSCFLRGSLPRLSDDWRQGKLHIHAGRATWQPSRRGSEPLELPIGGLVLEVSRPVLAWNGPKPNVCDSIKWVVDAGSFETAVPREQVALVVEVLGGSLPATAQGDG